MASVLQQPANHEGSLQAPSAQGSRSGTIKVVIGGAIILAVIVFVMLSSFQSNTVYYFTLPELQAQRVQITGQMIRVNGPLDKTSIQIDQKNLVLNFNMKEGELVLPVVYRGVIPDTLSSGESVVAEGKLDGNGVFQADTILVKCPSKYEKSEQED